MTAAGAPCPPNTIWFYSTRDKYGEFSNFHFCKNLSINGIKWKTTEHYFQAMKFQPTSAKDFAELQAIDSPMGVAKAGRERSRPLRKDWEAVKDGIMFDACMAKYTQDPGLWTLLDGTGDNHLVERTKNDSYWGDGGDGSGKNMLGHTLVRVRKSVRDQLAGGTKLPDLAVSTTSASNSPSGGTASSSSSAPPPPPPATQTGGHGEVPPEGTIWFYSTKEKYGEFANFFPCPKLTIGDSSWPTTEHFFQAMKFEASPKDFFEVAQMQEPSEAAKAGRDRSRPCRPDWEKVRDQIMLDALVAKFSQNADFAALLLSTGDQILVERTKSDNYWGDGGDGLGKNMLGILLMDVRSKLKAQQK